MAFLTGTASNHIDLWDTLLDFLQNNADLVAAGQEWSIAWQHPSNPELVMKAPGLAGTDEIFVGLKRTDGTLTLGESVIWLSGCTGILSSAPTFTQHVNSMPRTPGMFLDQNPMQYWMMANGRRFMVLLKISTVYQTCYGGLFLPYERPGSYPYPLYVGGTISLAGGTAAERPVSWRDSARIGYNHHVFPLGSGGLDSQAYMLDPGGNWRGFTRGASLNAYQYALMGPRWFPDGAATQTQFKYGYQSLRTLLGPGLNGEFPLTPFTLTSNTERPVTYGILDGCFSVSGMGNVAENIIEIDGVDHLVVPNVMRTAVDEYWAIALE